MYSLIQVLSALFALIAGFCRIAITPVKTTPPPNASEFDGAAINNGALVNLFSQVQQNAAPAFGNWGLANINPNLAATTYSAAQILGGLIRRQRTTGAATQDSTDTATNIVNALPGATVGQTFLTLIANLCSDTLTVAAGTGVTLTGTATIERFSTRLFMGQVLGSAAVTLNNVVEFGGSGANNL